MLRARFHANENDYRPVVWPIEHPYWCSGYGEGYAIVVAYVDSIPELLRLWPEATSITFETVYEYQFSGRFPKPKWMELSNV
jgi:hypothetical protein